MSRYTHLDPSKQEIRLLTIDGPSNDALIISCKLHPASLLASPVPEFVALSYVWGDPNLTEEILVDGETFAATANLVAALRNLRSILSEVQTTRSGEKGLRDVFLGHPTLFWIDAICINQQDIAERSSQVQIMGRIFKSAHHVVGWLGSDQELEQAAQDLQELSTQWVVPGDNHEAIQEFMNTQPLEEVFKGLDPNARFWQCDASTTWGYDRSIWDPIEKLLLLPYWERLWIRQEIYLARELVFLAGSNLLWWDAVSRFASQLVSCCDSSRIPPGIPAPRWRLHLEEWKFYFTMSMSIQRQKRSVGGIPMSFGDCRTAASEPRDHVFGVLGFSSVPLKVDYAAPVREVFMTYVAACLEANSGLVDSLLASAGTGVFGRDSNQHDLPSWVEDFSISGSVGSPGAALLSHADNAAGLTLPTLPEALTVDLRAGRLNIQSSCCGVIEQVHRPRNELVGKRGPASLFPYVWDVVRHYSGRVLHSGTHPIEAISRILRCDSQCANVSISPLTSTDIVPVVFLLVHALILFVPDEEIRQSLCLKEGPDFLSSFYSAFPFLDRDLAHTVFRGESLTETEVFSNLMETPDGPLLVSSGLAVAMEMAGGRFQFFHTTDNKLGMGPPGMVPSDLLYISPVTRWVLVVRRRQEGGVTYISPAFVLGLSHDKTVKMIQDGVHDEGFEFLSIF